MIWHWVGLAFFSITLLPAGAAMVAGRVPERLRPRLAPVRPRGWAVLALYAAAPLNTIPVWPTLRRRSSRPPPPPRASPPRPGAR